MALKSKRRFNLYRSLNPRLAYTTTSPTEQLHNTLATYIPRVRVHMRAHTRVHTPQRARAWYADRRLKFYRDFCFHPSSRLFHPFLAARLGPIISSAAVFNFSPFDLPHFSIALRLGTAHRLKGRFQRIEPVHFVVFPKENRPIPRNFEGNSK